jgi:hypothetical protein
MNRVFPLFLLAVLPGLLQAYEPVCCKGCASCPGCCAATQSPGIAKPGPQVKPTKTCAELIDILQDTNDPDTFLLAAFAVPSLGEEGRRAIPVVVRHASRLGLLKGLAKGEFTPAQEMLIDCLQMGSRDDASVPYQYCPIRQRYARRVSCCGCAPTYAPTPPADAPVCKPAVPATDSTPSSLNGGGVNPALPSAPPEHRSSYYPH